MFAFCVVLILARTDVRRRESKRDFGEDEKRPSRARTEVDAKMRCKALDASEGR